MKKLFITLLLSFIFSGNSSAIIINLKCTGFQSYNTSTNMMDNLYEDILRLIIDTNKNLMVSMRAKEVIRTWTLKEIEDGYFYSDQASDYKVPDKYNSATLNRYTGEFVSKHKRNNNKYHYICKKTNQLF